MPSNNQSRTKREIVKDPAKEPNQDRQNAFARRLKIKQARPFTPKTELHRLQNKKGEEQGTKVKVDGKHGVRSYPGSKLVRKEATLYKKVHFSIH